MQRIYINMQVPVKQKERIGKPKGGGDERERIPKAEAGSTK
jgi:hypothetical protein